MAGSVEEEDFAYSTLVNRWRRERGGSSLTKMHPRFYEGFDAELRELRETYEKEHALHPATPKVLILQDELANLQRVRDDIYDLRERKILTAALIAARGGNPDRTLMTKEEDQLYEEILRVLRDARRNLLRRGQPKDVPRAPGGPPTPPDPVATPHAPAQPAAVLAERGPASESSPESPLVPPTPKAPVESARPAETIAAVEAEAREPRRMGPARVLVRVTSPVEPFVGTDLRTYRLGVEDVAAVPKEIAHALVARGLAVAVGE